MNATEVNISYSNNCFVSCSDANYLSYLCYSDVGIAYSFWIWISISLNILILLWTFYCFYTIIHSRIKKNTFYFIISLNIITIILRLIWFLCRINGNTPDVLLGNRISNTVLLKLPQTFLFSELCGIIVVWKSIVHSTINYTVLTDSDYYAQYKFLMLFSVFNAICLIAFETISLYYPIFMHVSNGYAAFVIILLICGSIKYSLSIRAILTLFSCS